jgi:hypothetical protein
MNVSNLNSDYYDLSSEHFGIFVVLFSKCVTFKINHYFGDI